MSFVFPHFIMAAIAQVMCDVGSGRRNSTDGVWGDDSDTSDENNEEQEIIYDENPYCIVSPRAMQKMINERASCKYCNGSLTIIDVITCPVIRSSVVIYLLEH